MPGLHTTPGNTLLANHLLEPLLAHRPQRQMIIQQPAQQLPPVAVKTLLKLGVRERRSVPPSRKPTNEPNCSRLQANASGTARSPDELTLAPPPAAASSLSARPAGRTSSPEA